MQFGARMSEQLPCGMWGFSREGVVFAELRRLPIRAPMLLTVSENLFKYKTLSP